VKVGETILRLESGDDAGHRPEPAAPAPPAPRDDEPARMETSAPRRDEPLRTETPDAPAVEKPARSAKRAAPRRTAQPAKPGVETSGAPGAGPPSPGRSVPPGRGGCTASAPPGRPRARRALGAATRPRAGDRHPGGSCRTGRPHLRGRREVLRPAPH